MKKMTINWKKICVNLLFLSTMMNDFPVPLIWTVIECETFSNDAVILCIPATSSNIKFFDNAFISFDFFCCCCLWIRWFSLCTHTKYIFFLFMTSFPFLSHIFRLIRSTEFFIHHCCHSIVSKKCTWSLFVQFYC